eukprot:TRINITY_DN5561_c0_g1_i4.p1 TRINITY_DN5561_c0_g1~~TRINITY_DN5561_c0_g1_i4.p1  ORF type:complete len:305 (+),score=68.33 TRINITY_DN5561_c0_g1_i4:45-959(+)
MEIDTVAASSSAQPHTRSAEESLPWVEKYRPTDLSQVMGNEDAVQRLQIIAADGNMPHLLLSGPPGTGKTTSVLCLAHMLLGSSFRDAVLELNASDDRGIDTVRTKIKMFAQKKVTLPPGRHKIIILDEADSMTDAAQQALRRTMEIYSATTRFALACNMSSNIIEPIQSRCAILRYTRLADEQIMAKLLEICENEKVAYTSEGLEAIIFTAEGDARQAINNLQSTHAGMALVDADNVFKICDQPHPKLVRSIIESCLQGSLDEAIAILMEHLWNQTCQSRFETGLHFTKLSFFFLGRIWGYLN